ncbi:OmpA-like transmembrane domain protein [Variibacter gotjawalensis]|uniref:OmpA-like transmembrane domain protein n=1 Tax=Variibacter gotjawalensis TaxID=1333996 RepID=A0A0S3PYJ9_9BRAD|nr:outer membrane protein [Variibacter gotjawalensis]NIK46862.1 outer membrane immunogenic protein [Variibacter gotjawalensis]RZS48766.1 outer membrane immunogenic protein [Variibacter gotjawalensis]BAT61025.1 OmpA-like transmembrane domain protein [Variibacter gotjawalensis]
MKKFTLALLAGTALMAAPAVAADLGRPIYKAPVAVAAPYMLWNGFYIGANAGYSWGRDRVGGGRADTDGFSGGGQIGYNWQFSPNWVFGIEADLQGSNIESDVALLNTNVHMWGTVRGRLGYAWNNVLLYGTGGFAYGRNELTGFGVSQSKTHTGYTFGGGLEYAFAPQWSAKVEYLYVDLGREFYDAPAFQTNVRSDFHTVRLGINYRFGGAPIVASY